MNRIIDDIKQQMKMHGRNVTKLINAMRLTVDECADIGSSIDNKMQTIYEQIQGIILQIQKNTIEITNTVEPVLLASKKNVDQTREAIIESLNAHQIAVNEQKALIQPNFHHDFKTTQSQLKNILTQKMMLAHDLMGKVAINNTFAMGDSRNCIETYTTNLSSKRDIIEINEEIPILRRQINEHQFRFSEQYKENSGAFNVITSNAQEMSKKMIQEISACRKQVKYFHELDFCEYQPSGNVSFATIR